MCDYPEFYSETYPRARKERTCCECHQAIPIGVQYARCAGKSDGEMFSKHLHLACRDFGKKLDSLSDADCIPFGFIEEALKDFDDWGLEACNVPSLRNEWEYIKRVVAA